MVSESSRSWPLEDYPALNPADFPDIASFAKLRKPIAQLKCEVRSKGNVQVSWSEVVARDGASIPLLHYEPRETLEEACRPLCVVFHGGGMRTYVSAISNSTHKLKGWIAGDYSVEDSFCRQLVERQSFLVISVHYRL